VPLCRHEERRVGDDHSAAVDDGRELLARAQAVLARKRAELLAHIQNTHHQYNLPEPRAKIAYKANREGVADVFADLDARKSVE